MQRVITKLIEKLSSANPEVVSIREDDFSLWKDTSQEFYFQFINSSEWFGALLLDETSYSYLGLCGMLLFERYISNCCLSFVCSSCVKIVWMWVYLLWLEWEMYCVSIFEWTVLSRWCAYGYLFWWIDPCWPDFRDCKWEMSITIRWSWFY